MSKLSIFDELQKFSSAIVNEKGEIDVYETSIFLNVIRRREFEIIFGFIQNDSSLILDYGCGGGWLSNILSIKGFNVVGIDINSNLLKVAKRTRSTSEFILSDAESLPFRENSFDNIIGIAILHHLILGRALKEIKRIGKPNFRLLFMEPNVLNPLSSFGRRLFPLEIHTIGEKPFLPSHLKASFEKNEIKVDYVTYIFFMTFPVARLLKLLEIRLPNVINKLIFWIETSLEKIPILRGLNSNIVITGRSD